MSNLCGSVVSLGLTIASAVLIFYVITGSSSDLLVALKVDTMETQIRLDALQANLTVLEMCHTTTNETVMALMNCSDIAVAGISYNTALIVNKTTTLSQNSVAAINATVVQAIQVACDNIALLESRIAEAVANQTAATPRALQNGTVTVRMEGGDQFNITYSLNQLVLGDLRWVYLTLPVWPYSLTAANVTVNPVIFYENFVPEVMVVMAGGNLEKPLMTTQSSRIQWQNVNIRATGFKWDGALKIQNLGTTVYLDTVAQVGELTFLVQML